MLARLSRLAARRIVKLEAALKGVAGFTGAGRLRCAVWSDGRRTAEASLTGIAGVKAEIVINGAPIGALAVRDGVVAGRLDTARGAPVLALSLGDAIEIRQNGAAILRGKFGPA